LILALSLIRQPVKDFVANVPARIRTSTHLPQLTRQKSAGEPPLRDMFGRFV
jgi:hypothetical protein